MKKLLCTLLAIFATVTMLFCFTITASAEDALDISDKVEKTLPVQFDPSIDMFEVEDVFDEDGSGFNHNTFDKFDYYYLKGEYGKTYMTMKFQVDRPGTYDMCIGLMAIGSTVPRSCEFEINGGQRYYVSRLYNHLSDTQAEAEYVTGITAYLKEGENKITFYVGYDFDNVSVKSVFVDNVFYCRTGDLPNGYKFPDDDIEEETVDITGADPTIIRFDQNFSSLITSTIYCSREYITDPERGNVMHLTVTESVGNPQISFSYTKYLKLLGLDPDANICDEYPYLVLAIKADENLADGVVQFFPFTDGETIIYIDQAYQEYYDADSGWQYIVFEMNTYDKWGGTFNGGCLFVGGIGEEPGATVDLSELRLFKTYDEAEIFAGIKQSDNTTAGEITTAEEVTEPETTVEEKTIAESETTIEATAPVAESTIAEETTATEEKSGCGSMIGFAVFALIPAGFVIKKKRKS